MGGYPGAVNRYRFLKQSNVLERMKQSELVGDIDEVKGTKEELGLRFRRFACCENAELSGGEPGGRGALLCVLYEA